MPPEHVRRAAPNLRVAEALRDLLLTIAISPVAVLHPAILVDGTTRGEAKGPSGRVDRMSNGFGPDDDDADDADTGDAGNDDATSPKVEVALTVIEKLGAVTAALGVSEARPQQVEMVERIARALDEGRPVAIQAGTGVGKTFGYLTPAISHARATGDKVVVVTSSIALQDQLARKDLPFLEAHHPDRFSWLVLKGRSNYLCEAALTETRRLVTQAQQGSLELETSEPTLSSSDLERLDQAQLAKILEWSRSTRSGDRAELGAVLDAEPDAATWGAVSVAPGACPGADRCAHGDDCLYEKRKRRAHSTDVIVVNAHLYGAHLALDGGLLPEHRVVVVDEAHEFVDAVIGALSVELSRTRVLQLTRLVRSVSADAADDLRDLEAAAQRFHDTVMLMARARAETGRPMRLANGMATDPDLVESAVALLAPLVSLTATLRETRDNVEPGAAGRIEGAMLAVSTFHSDITDRLLASPDGRGDVVYLEHGDTWACVKATSIAIGNRLRTVVWDEGVVPVLTSATLPASIPLDLGIEQAEWADVGTPFPFRDNALLYVPKRFPEPRGASIDAWRSLATEELLDIIDAAGGRTLALFTTNRAVGDAAKAARARFPNLTIYAQGELPKAELTHRFISDETSCLFATASFWTGIDAQGATLRAVVIDKLPFPVPTDPIMQAKEEMVGSEKSFALVSVPATAIRLAQGAGRLIRTSTDQGVVAVLDPRLATKSYRTQLLACLPPMRRTIDRNEVLTFLRELRDAPKA